MRDIGLQASRGLRGYQEKAEGGPQLYSKQRKKILDKIRSGYYDAILLSPPCSTFSRAPWANKKGPRPVRCFENPRGLDSLTASERDRAILGNVFADFCYEVIACALDTYIKFLLLEQPEDLGAMRYGPYQGQRPASMWQWPQLAEILRRAGVITCVFHQGNLGAGYPKPTRLLLKTTVQLPSFYFLGPPTFDKDGFYTGPLPVAKGMGSIRSRQTSGSFKTSGTECWPARMCQWIASLLVSTWEPTATTATLGASTTSTATQDSYPVCKPEGARILGGHGPPRTCDILEGQKPFHDGGGLCSPGRWPHARRILAEGDDWSWIHAKLFDIACFHAGGVKELEREVFRMATGGEEGCRLLRNQAYIADMVIALCEWLEAQELSCEGLSEIAPGQPLRLRLIRALLQAADDPDRDFLLQAEKGLPVGILRPLPRTPHVFEEQIKWPLDREPWEPGLVWVPNYGSTRDHRDFAKDKFEEEVREGMMEKMSLDEFKDRYGENRAIAALAVIVEDEEKGKKRLIHDAAHGVRVNHRIKCRDRIRTPGAREKKQILLETMERGEVAFSIVGDFSKAHRRFKHSEDGQGFLGCQLGIPGEEDIVYVNKVGTFGVNCASYWWTRIAAAGLRATYHLIGPCPLDMLLYADDLESLATSRRGRICIVLSYSYLSAMGYPFKWSKTRGGYRVEWLGMETEYASYKLGLTERRSRWLIEWLRDKVKSGYVSATEMAQGLGRLGFAAISLDWERPFLRPLYAWSSAIQGKPGPMKIPTMLRVLFSWLADRFEKGDRLQRPLRPPRGEPPLTFFTDAKAENGRAWIGGFLEISAGRPGPWFSLEIERYWAPWAFAKSSPNKVIAALELLATLVAAKIWIPSSDQRQATRMAIRGYTDNQSNEALIKRHMTTKFSSCLILMEMAEELSAKRCDMQLTWIRRELNQLADDLTDEKFDSFDARLRIPLKGEELRWLVLDKLLSHADGYYKELVERKAKRGRGPPRRFGKSRKLNPW